MRHFFAFIAALLVSISVFAQSRDALRYWNEVLDRYEQLCNACLEHRSTKEIKSKTESLQEILKAPVGKMTAEQQKRFTSIQNRYKGITESLPTVQERPMNIVKVDTVRRVEHVTVIDTVFVKEILGEVEILQQLSRRDTVVHIIRQDDSVIKTASPDTVYIERSPTVHKEKSAKAFDIFIMAETGVMFTPSYGAMIAIGHGNGGYVKFRDSLHHPKTASNCSSNDLVWTTGSTEHGRTTITAGGMVRITPWCNLYAGAGYGSYELAWEDAKGRWLYIEDGSGKGAALDLGLLFHHRFLSASFGISYTAPKLMDLEIGIGIRF